MKFRIVYILLLAVLASCGAKSKSKEELKSDFKQVSESAASDTAKARTFIKDAGLYIKTHEQDSANVHFIRLIAETYTMLGDGGGALESWERLRNEYPKHPLAAEALFKRAFVLSEMLNKKEESRPVYEEFLILYPDHHLAEAARFQIQTLDKSQAELLQMIMQKADSNQASAPTSAE